MQREHAWTYSLLSICGLLSLSGCQTNQAEAAYLGSEFEEMEHLAQVVLQHARMPLDKVNMYEIKIRAYTAQSKLSEALKTGRQALRLLGERLPEKPNKFDILRGLVEVKVVLTFKHIENLIDLPAMTDPTKSVIMRILANLFTTAVTINMEASLRGNNPPWGLKKVKHATSPIYFSISYLIQIHTSTLAQCEWKLLVEMQIVSDPLLPKRF